MIPGSLWEGGAGLLALVYSKPASMSVLHAVHW